MIGGFPSETMIIDLIKRGELETLKTLLTWEVYVYMAVWVILFIVSLVVQYKTRSEEDKEKLDKNFDNYNYYSEDKNGKKK
jgi:ammonia channel protein AmtB